jgi:phage replication initiation protein
MNMKDKSTNLNESIAVHFNQVDQATPPRFAGASGNPGGSPDDSLIEKPPNADRGVQITIPPENRSLIDWIGFTLKVDDPLEALELIQLPPSLFTKFQRGYYGYKQLLQYGNISVNYQGREGMGCHVEMTGQGCRQFETLFKDNPWPGLIENLLAAGANFTRIDLAIDNVDGGLSLEKIGDSLHDRGKKVRTRFGEWRHLLRGGFHEGKKIIGETIYLGSSKSHLMFRVYNKAQETGVVGHWIRFEIQLREKRAHEAAKLFNSESIGSLATGIINNYFAVINADDSNVSRCSLQDWWAAWLQSTEKITLTTEQEVKFVTDTMDFIKKQYAPTLSMISKHLGNANFKEYVNEVLEDGNKRMGAKHEKILAASSGKRRGKS